MLGQPTDHSVAVKAIASQAQYPLPWLARHPLCGAVMAEAMWSGHQGVLLQLEQSINGILVFDRAGGL